MEFNQYNTTVQQWIHTVLENRETNADVVLECCRDIIAYGRIRFLLWWGNLL